MLAAARRGLALPRAAASLALAGNILLGFTACVVRTRTGEPGAAAGGPSLGTVWWTVLTVRAVAIAVSAGGRRLPRWRLAS